MPTYAKTTTVSAEKTKMEIEQVLRRYGADAFVHGWDQERAMLQFRLKGRVMRFVVALPSKQDPVFEFTPKTREMRTSEGIEAAWQQAIRQRWRALLLIIKAKLEAIEAGITTLEEEFLGWMVLPDNTTVSQWMIPQVKKIYELGQMPSMLALPEAEKETE